MSFLIHALSFLTNFLLSLNLKCMENRLLDFKEKKIIGNYPQNVDALTLPSAVKNVS